MAPGKVLPGTYQSYPRKGTAYEASNWNFKHCLHCPPSDRRGTRRRSLFIRQPFPMRGLYSLLHSFPQSQERQAKKALLWNVPKALGSYEELIESGEADVIYIAMINSEHYHYAKLALEAGRHVLCEKPFTLEPSQAEELFALARRKGLFLMEMQKVVFLPVVRQIKDLIQKGGFGRITMADFSSSFDAGYNGWFFDGAKGGGPLYGNAGYSLQLMQYLLDCYAAEWTGLCTRSQSGVEDQFFPCSAYGK